MRNTTKLPPPSSEILKKAQHAQRPGRYPRGFFDSLMEITRTLLDRGHKLCHAADFLIDNGQLQAPMRHAYQEAMRARFHRLREKQARHLTDLKWRHCLMFDAVHLVGTNNTTALCGVKCGHWETWHGGGQIQCTRCKGAARKQGVTVAEE